MPIQLQPWHLTLAEPGNGGEPPPPATGIGLELLVVAVAVTAIVVGGVTYFVIRRKSTNP